MHPAIGLIIIGDEILSGKRRDRHFDNAIALLHARGLDLSWSTIIGDDPELITRTLRRTFANGDIVFCFGGIGATPDDYTRQCAASALDEPLVQHPDAVSEMRARFGEEGLTPNRLVMAEFPQSSRIIPNPYNRIAGFSVKDHHFLPGFPEMAEPMMAWVLDSQYQQYFGEDDLSEIQLDLQCHEGPLIELMKEVGQKYASVKLSSLPRLDGEKPWVEFVLRGPAEVLQAAHMAIEARLAQLGIRWTNTSK